MTPALRACSTTRWRATSLLALTITMGGCASQKGSAATGAVPHAGSGPTAVATSAEPPPTLDAGSRLPGQKIALPPEDRPASDKTTSRTDPTWATCHQKVRPKGVDPAKDVAALARACEAITKMKLVGETILGKQADAEPPQSYPFKAEAKRCYRVYAQGESRIEELDVAIKDSAGAIAGHASTTGSTAVVFDDGAVCFKTEDAASVVVSVGRGGGRYAVQIWADSLMTSGTQH